LIWLKIVSWTDVPPEYLVFRIFVCEWNEYLKAKEEEKEGSWRVCDPESDNEEIDYPLESADLSLEAGTSITVMIWNKLWMKMMTDLACDVGDADGKDLDTIDNGDDESGDANDGFSGFDERNRWL